LLSLSLQDIPLKEALRCLRAYSLLPTPETVEINLSVNMLLKRNKRKDAFRGTLVYPERFGHETRILLLAEVSVVGGCDDINVHGHLRWAGGGGAVNY
jgi:ribosomal protein L1